MFMGDMTMIRKPGGVGRTASRPSGADRGFTLSETIVLVFLVGFRSKYLEPHRRLNLL